MPEAADPQSVAKKLKSAVGRKNPMHEKRPWQR
jgi:hypothetical protein